MKDEKVRENVELGIQCPECGSYAVENVTAITGRVDAGTMSDIYGCGECGHFWPRSVRDAKPGAGQDPDPLRRESDGWTTSREAVGWSEGG